MTSEGFLASPEVARQSPSPVPAAVLSCISESLFSPPAHPLLPVTHHQPCLHTSASIQTLTLCQSCLNRLTSLPAFLKHHKCANGKTTSSFPCCFLAENPCTGNKAKAVWQKSFQLNGDLLQDRKNSISSQKSKSHGSQWVQKGSLIWGGAGPSCRCRCCTVLGEKHTEL